MVEESQHEYQPNMNITKKLYIPGATSICFEFDERCQTESSYDILSFSTGPGGYKSSSEITEMRIEGKPRTLKHTVRANPVWMKFVSDGSNQYWGWKFTYYNPEVKEETDLGHPKIQTALWLVELLLQAGVELTPGQSSALLGCAMQLPEHRPAILAILARALREKKAPGNWSAAKQVLEALHGAALASNRMDEVAHLTDLLLMFQAAEAAEKPAVEAPGWLKELAVGLKVLETFSSRRQPPQSFVFDLWKEKMGVKDGKLPPEWLAGMTATLEATLPAGVIPPRREPALLAVKEADGFLLTIEPESVLPPGMVARLTKDPEGLHPLQGVAQEKPGRMGA